MVSSAITVSIGLLFVSSASGKLCWPGMDQTKWPCSDAHDDFMNFVADSPNSANDFRYQNIQGACTPCRLDRCDKTKRIEQDLQHCQWHVMPEFPRVYWQNTGNGCDLCIDGRCKAFYGTYISPDECKKETDGRKIYFQKTEGICKPCYEGRCLMDIGRYDSAEECERLEDDVQNVQITAPIMKLCITCYVSPCPPSVRNACDTQMKPLGKKYYQNLGKGCYICFGAKKDGQPRKQGECESRDQRYESKEQCEAATTYQGRLPFMKVKFQKTGPGGACEMCYEGHCAMDIHTYDTKDACDSAPKEEPFGLRSCVPYC